MLVCIPNYILHIQVRCNIRYASSCLLIYKGTSFTRREIPRNGQIYLFSIRFQTVTSIEYSMITTRFIRDRSSYHSVERKLPPFCRRYFKIIFLGAFVSMISLKFVLKCPINDKPELVQILAWCRISAKPISEPKWRKYTRPASMSWTRKNICGPFLFLSPHPRPPSRHLLFLTTCLSNFRAIGQFRGFQIP